MRLSDEEKNELYEAIIFPIVDLEVDLIKSGYLAGPENEELRERLRMLNTEIWSRIEKMFSVDEKVPDIEQAARELCILRNEDPDEILATGPRLWSTVIALRNMARMEYVMKKYGITHKNANRREEKQ